MTEEEIKQRIITITNELTVLKRTLFKNRLLDLINLKEHQLRGVSNIRFHIEQFNQDEWIIEYDYSGEYNPDIYDYEYDENKTNININTTVSFGKKDRYFVHRNDASIPLRIFRNSFKKLRIINSDYSISLDIDEQQNLIERYMTSNIPEWLALKVFDSIGYNNWDDNDVITYLSVI